MATIDMGRKLGALRGGARSPYDTMSLGLKPTSLPSGILIHPAIWPPHGPKIVGAPPQFGRGGAGSLSNNLTRAEACLHAKFHVDLFNRLATVHERYRQAGQDNCPIANGRPKTLT